MVRKNALQCMVEDCDQPRAKGVHVCGDHLLQTLRCTGRVKLYAETDQDHLLPPIGDRRCRNAAVKGGVRCRAHGGGGKIATRGKVLTDMQKYVQPYEGPIDPLTAFEDEFRFTWGRILWLRDRIGSIKDEKDLYYGLVKEERINATEFTGTNRTYEARIHPYEEQLRWERTKLDKMTAMWLKAGIEQERLSVTKAYVSETYELLMETVRMCGLDPDDPVVHERLLRLISDYPAKRRAALATDSPPPSQSSGF